jgi:hypothetical protein
MAVDLNVVFLTGFRSNSTDENECAIFEVKKVNLREKLNKSFYFCSQ